MSEKDKKILEKTKQDINFLSNPMWIVSPRVASKGVDGIYRFTVKYNEYTYEVRSTYKLPAFKDRIILLYLLIVSQQRGWVCDITDLTISDIIRGCGFSKNKQNYKRIVDSMKRWGDMVYDFDNGFYDGAINEHRSEKFHILSYKNDGSKISVSLNPRFINIMEASRFYRWIDFDVCRRLGNATALRLYEILTAYMNNPNVDKSKRRGKDEWAIRTITLSERCGFIDRYPSNVERKILPALEILSERGGLDYKAEFFKKNGIHYTKFVVGEAVVDIPPDDCRDRVSDESVCPEPDNDQGSAVEADLPPVPTKVDLLDLSGQGRSWQKIVNTVPQKARKSSKGLEMLREFYDSEGFQRTFYLVSYAASKSKSNFWGFVRTCLKGNVDDVIDEVAENIEVNYKYAIDTRVACGHHLFLEVCNHRGVIPEDAITWAKENSIEYGDTV